MNLEHVLALYDAEVRASPQARPGLSVERTGGVLRLMGHFNFIASWDLSPDTAQDAVAAQAAHFRSRGEALLWRVYDHDQPEGLSDCLAREGFEPRSPGTLMFFDLAGELAGGGDGAIDVRRVRTVEALDGFVTVAGQAFGDEEPWRRTAYAGRLDEPDLALFVAYVSGEAAASARLEMAPGVSFGSLFGGGVAPAYRRRGLYRALVAARAEEARRRGLRYLSIEALETSRPILQRLGFIPAARETTWTLRP